MGQTENSWEYIALVGGLFRQMFYLPALSPFSHLYYLYFTLPVLPLLYSTLLEYDYLLYLYFTGI